MKYREWIFGEFEVQYKVKNKVRASELPQILTSREAFEQFRTYYGDDYWNCESFAAAYLNRNNRIYSIKTISKGSLVSTVVDPSSIFKHAILLGSLAVIVCHNHPSGNIKPSSKDLEFTKKLVAAGKVMEINVIDSIILCDENYYSFADDGLI